MVVWCVITQVLVPSWLAVANRGTRSNSLAGVGRREFIEILIEEIVNKILNEG